MELLKSLTWTKTKVRNLLFSFTKLLNVYVCVCTAVRSISGHKAAICSLDFHRYGDILASGSMDTNLKVEQFVVVVVVVGVIVIIIYVVVMGCEKKRLHLHLQRSHRGH